jgi:hypothetical protein
LGAYLGIIRFLAWDLYIVWSMVMHVVPGMGRNKVLTSNALTQRFMQHGCYIIIPHVDLGSFSVIQYAKVYTFVYEMHVAEIEKTRILHYVFSDCFLLFAKIIVFIMWFVRF